MTRPEGPVSARWAPVSLATNAYGWRGGNAPEKPPGSGRAFPPQAIDFLISVHPAGLLQRSETTPRNLLYQQQYSAHLRTHQSRAFKSFHRLVIATSQPNRQSL